MNGEPRSGQLWEDGRPVEGPPGGSLFTEPGPLPREMVLASAGSGKTYHLSSRLVGLLAREEAPEAIWASTFTRKAAAEILDRVLLRLARGALDETAARELAAAAWLDDGSLPPDGFLDREHCGRLLAKLVRSLHRTNIGTLDSFFVQVATTFSEELGLPPAWRLVQGPAEDLMRSEALEAVLAGEDSAVMAELVRIMGKGEVRRGVHTHLMEKVDDLLLLHREVDPTVPDAWKPVFSGLGPGGVFGEDEIRVRCVELAAALDGVDVPLTKKGTPRAHWKNELPRLAQAVRDREWKALFSQGLGAKLVAPGTVVPPESVIYDGHAPDARLAGILVELVRLARADLARDLTGQGQALGRMAARYREAFEAVQLAQGGFRFQDVTHLLREARLLGDADALYFRLDARIRHLLLDEFQDTSLSQWEVLAPLVSELLAGGDTERAAVLVADPKQSIYGWRGARPELVERVREGHGLEHLDLPKSYRSGPAVLEAVAEVFQGIDANPVVREMDGGQKVAGAWRRDFFPQTASDPGQPGYIRLVVGPQTDGRSTVQSALLDYTADLIGDLHAQAPRASVGVLVRANVVVSYLIAALRKLQIPASGEGGTPLTDARPVNALLALLRLADHPGDRLARYHVAQSPVGEMTGFTNFQAGAEANRLARRIRGRLLRNGYGATLDEWVRELRGSCDEMERARLLQFVELGFRWDAQRTLRPGDFVRFVEGEGVEDPSGARVRVMTVHQAKGLQFDVVVLPHLYQSLEDRGATDPVVPLRDPETGQVIQLYPATDKGTRALFPELRVAHEQDRALRLRDELSNLYVAMTRAKYALHMVVPADGERGPGKAKSFARILRAALAPDEDADVQGKALYRHGVEDWMEHVAAGGFSGGGGREGAAQAASGLQRSVSLRAISGGRTRNLARRSPSSLEGGEQVDLATLLRMDLSGSARLRGTVIHAWCERIGWLEDGLPDDAVLRSIAHTRAPGIPSARLEEWLADFRGWIYSAETAGALSRARYPEGARVEQELPFLHRQADGLLQGFIDRLVLVEEEGRVVEAEVQDFKTDLLDGSDAEAVAAKVTFYRPQIHAYRDAVAGRYGLNLAAVKGTLLFLRPGLVREV